MAGFWHLSHHQMRDLNGNILAGAKAYFYEADTLSPITVYQDYGLGTAHPNPVEANAYGVFPPVFLNETDGFYRQRITSSGGVIIPGTDVGILPIIGPSAGSGGSEVPVDANSVLQTGDPLWVPVTGTRSGFVRMNGRTIGSASSGAGERANADCENLYLYNWANFSDTLCAVTGGRGISAAADWAANKPMALLDMRSRGPFGLDDMGNSALSAFTGITFAKGTATTGGASAGVVRHTLTEAELPSVTMNVPAQQPTLSYSTNSSVQSGGGTSAVGAIGDGNDYANAVTPTGDATPGTVSFGSGNAHNNMPPFILGTWYQRL